MHALILAAALIGAPASSSDKTAADACKPPHATQTAMRGVQGPRKLAELPDARLNRAVIRTVGDCYVSEVRTATGQWRYEPDGKAKGGLLAPNANPYVERLR